MNVLTEMRLSAEAAASFAGVEVQSIRRWHRVGLGGVRLEGVWVGRRFVTSQEAVLRFISTTSARKVN